MVYGRKFDLVRKWESRVFIFNIIGKNLKVLPKTSFSQNQFYFNSKVNNFRDLNINITTLYTIFNFQNILNPFTLFRKLNSKFLESFFTTENIKNTFLFIFRHNVSYSKKLLMQTMRTTKNELCL